MIRRYLFLISAILIVTILAAGCIEGMGSKDGAPVGTPGPAAVTTTVTSYAPPGKITTTPELVAFVTHAAAFARENGRDAAIAAFNDPNGPFVIGTIQVFALDYDGTLLADAGESERVGTNIMDMTDSFGIPFVRKLAETAGLGRGYVSYRYLNPAKNNTNEPRIAVVEDVDGTYYVGAAMFASEGEVFPSLKLNMSAAHPDVDDLVAYVKSAVLYAKEHGREKALWAFNDPDGEFVRGELVMMAFDFQGMNLAAPPYSPELVNYRINLINYQDPDGVETIRGLRDIAKGGGGFFYTVARVNADDRSIYIPKIDYAEPVDNDWWIFSGVIAPEYASAATGNLTGVQIRYFTRDDLYNRVNEAVAFAKENGKQKTLAEINNPQGRFVTGDLFVWASSRDGVLLADPFWKSGVGQNHWEYADRHGMKVTQVGIQAMENGTGFSHALFPNTALNGTENVHKLIYMKAVDDTWWIGGGIYGIRVD
ncbi:MAG TPA: cache domain-containing protein [Methanolinea sp.]|nr:cache domain-containing protein [Methanolinea sp.]HQK55118.1 cache domain-containing protein [Methanolinea sp.]